MMETKDLLKLVDSLQAEPERGLNDHILILDGLNTFIRSFAVRMQINSAGVNVGGMVGFLRSLASMNRLFHPTRLIVAWDGRGGAQNRKNLDSNYKAQRAHASVIHYDLYETKAEELESMQDQVDRLSDYIACLPVSYVQLDKLEADDIIAYMAKTAARAGKRVTVVSSDKDFLQLIEPNLEVYSPIKKVLYVYPGYKKDREEACEVVEIQDFLQVLPENYNIIKSLVGDASDGLPGVKGVGIRKLIKEFPRLQQDPDYSLDALFEECAAAERKKTLHNKILADWHHVETNFKIMDLNSTVLDDTEKHQIAFILNQPIGKLRIGNFLHLLDADKIDFFKDAESWLCQFSNLERK